MLFTVLLKNYILQIKRHLCKLLLVGNINQDDNTMIWYDNDDEEKSYNLFVKDWQAMAELKPLSLFISLLLTLKKALDNVKKDKWKVKVVSALQ